MNKSESIEKLGLALAKAQGECQKPKRNRQGYGYKYSDMDEVLDSCREALLKNGISIVQHPVRFDENVGVETLLIHSSGQFLESVFTTPVKAFNPQKIGAIITYYRRYSVMAMMLIAPEDDDGQSITDIGKVTVANTPIDAKDEDFVISFGKKYPNKKLKEIPRDELENYVDFVDDNKQKMEGVVRKKMDNFVTVATRYLEA